MNTVMDIRHPRVYFDATDETAVEEFLFIYDDMCLVMKRKEWRVSSLFANIEGEARAAYRSRFVEKWSSN